MTIDIQSIPKLVISLPEREDRLTQVMKELPKLFFDPSFIMSEGIRDTPVQAGIVKAHKEAIRYARKKNWKYVLVMEDDLKLSDSPELIGYVTEAFRNIPDHFGCLLGSAYNGLIKTHSLFWNRIENFAGAHFVVYREEVYDTILNHGFGINNYDRELSNIITVFVACKMFSSEYSGYSDHSKRIVDHSHHLVKHDLLG